MFPTSKETLSPVENERRHTTDPKMSLRIHRILRNTLGSTVFDRKKNTCEWEECNASG